MKNFSHMAILFRSWRLNRNSFVALAAALEQYGEPVGSVPIFWATDARTEAFLSTLSVLLDTHERVVVAYSLMTPQLPKVTAELALLSRETRRSRIVLVAGGPHAAGTPRSTLALGFDAVCVGEGEETFPEMIGRIEAGGESLESVAGLYLKGNGRTEFTGRRSRAEKTWERSAPFPVHRQKFAAIEITRGCPYRCKYCQTPVLKGTRVRHRSLDAIFAAVVQMRRAGKKDVRFITPNALSYGSPDGCTPSLDAVSALLNGMRHRLPPDWRIFFGSFPSEVRPDFVSRASLQLIREVCHNRSVVLGAQSGSVTMLRRMRRGHGPEAVECACELLLSEGFEPIVDFILGFPGERPEQMAETLKLMEKLAGQGVKLHMHAFMPLPGTPWAASTPSPIPRPVRKQLDCLSSSGKLFGQWKRQEWFTRK